jgi:hypothetical protein
VKRKPCYEAMLEAQLDHLDVLPPEREFRFHPTRRWRFDLAWEGLKLAVEINGGVWIPGGRHNRGRDYEKLNAAAALGWCVLQFTPSEVRCWTAAQTVATIITGREVRVG